MTETPLDRAWAAATAEGADDAAMARYYDVLAAAELFLAIDPATLEGAAAPRPLLFPVEGVETALIFDTEARLAAFAPGGAHLTLSGRAAMAMFAGKGVALAVNLGDAPSATVLPAEAVDWAAAALRQPIEATEAAAGALGPPRGATPALLQAIDAKVAALGPAVAEAWLCGLGADLALCVVMRAPGAEAATVAALAETARFAGGDRAAFDIAVLAAGDPRLAAARAVGLGFEPAAPEAPRMERAAPGMDPDAPPRLR